MWMHVFFFHTTVVPSVEGRVHTKITKADFSFYVLCRFVVVLVRSAFSTIYDGATYKASCCEETGVRTVCFCLLKEHNNTTKPLLTGNSTTPCTVREKHFFIQYFYWFWPVWNPLLQFQVSNKQTNNRLGKLEYVSNWRRWVCHHQSKTRPHQSSIADTPTSVPEADPSDHISPVFPRSLQCHILHSVSWSHLAHQPFCYG